MWFASCPSFLIFWPLNITFHTRLCNRKLTPKKKHTHKKTLGHLKYHSIFEKIFFKTKNDRLNKLYTIKGNNNLKLFLYLFFLGECRIFLLLQTKIYSYQDIFFFFAFPETAPSRKPHRLSTTRGKSITALLESILINFCREPFDSPRITYLRST